VVRTSGQPFAALDQNDRRLPWLRIAESADLGAQLIGKHQHAPPGGLFPIGWLGADKPTLQFLGKDW
jgi:hypothetical protein